MDFRHQRNRQHDQNANMRRFRAQGHGISPIVDWTSASFPASGKNTAATHSTLGGIARPCAE